MNLKTAQKTVIEVEDWNEFIVETYKIPYDLQQQEGCLERGTVEFSVPCENTPIDFENDSIVEKVNGPEEGVSFEAWLRRDPTMKLKDEDDSGDLSNFNIRIFYHRNFYPSFSVLVQDLYNRNLIEAGKYTINIDW